MCGGYSAIKDIYKTDLYKIAKWRNANIPKNSKNKVQNIFSKNILTKEPTAELRHNQKDSDSLPEYPVLDKILKMFLEKRFSSLRIADNGFDKKLVEKIEGLILRSEYKRRQAAIGPKISNLSFDKDRRIPITNGFKSNG